MALGGGSLAGELEIAWAAGLFEGEGSMSIPRKATGFQNLRASLGMTDFDVVEHFHDVMGVGRCKPHREERPHWKPCLTWTACGAEAVSAVVLMLPYFGQRRTERAIECLTWFRGRFVAICGGCGQPFVRANAKSIWCSGSCGTRTRRGNTARNPLLPSGAPLVLRGTERQAQYAGAIQLLEEYL